MNRSEYLGNAHVRDFLAWANPLATGDRPLRHVWNSPKWGTWSFSSLWDGYLTYEWRFSVTLPGERTVRSGTTLSDSIKVLDAMSSLLRTAVTSGDSGTFLNAAVAVVYWGRVQQNEYRLQKLGDEALPLLLAAAAQMDPSSADTSRLDRVTYMNSGFSKIYALLLDDFPIYDSRVACSMASLSRMYCQVRGLPEVPPTLSFGIPASRGSVSRDPSRGTLRFPRLRPGQPRRYAESNIKAAWLLDALSELGPFGSLEPDRRLLALQSAMFMLGYAPMELPPGSHS